MFSRRAICTYVLVHVQHQQQSADKSTQKEYVVVCSIVRSYLAPSYGASCVMHRSVALVHISRLKDIGR